MRQLIKSYFGVYYQYLASIIGTLWYFQHPCIEYEQIKRISVKNMFNKVFNIIHNHQEN